MPRGSLRKTSRGQGHVNRSKRFRQWKKLQLIDTGSLSTSFPPTTRTRTRTRTRSASSPGFLRSTAPDASLLSSPSGSEYGTATMPESSTLPTSRVGIIPASSQDDVYRPESSLRIGRTKRRKTSHALGDGDFLDVPDDHVWHSSNLDDPLDEVSGSVSSFSIHDSNERYETFPASVSEHDRQRLRSGTARSTAQHGSGPRVVARPIARNGRQHAKISSRERANGAILTTADSEAPSRQGSEAKGSPARANRFANGKGWHNRIGIRSNLSRAAGEGNSGSRGRPRGRKGAGDEDQDPPRSKQLSEEEEEQLKRLRQRQLELKKIFVVVGTYQLELLDQLASRDLNRLLKKARAHVKLPEYEQVKLDIQQVMETQQLLFNKKFQVARAAEIARYDYEIEVIGAKCRRRCEETRLEHLQGLQGDIISLKKAHAMALDETCTEAGSDVDYFPRYHEIPEADAHVRGYASSRITDEKPFKEFLESRGDLDLRDVINEDITGPMIEAIAKENAKHAEEQRVRETRTVKALQEEALKRLEDMEPRYTAKPSNPSNEAYALSLLADVSGWAPRQTSERSWEPGSHISPEPKSSALEMPSHAGEVHVRPFAQAPQSSLQQIFPLTTASSKRPRNQSKASASSTSSNPVLRPSTSVHTPPQVQPSTNGTHHDYHHHHHHHHRTASQPKTPIAPYPSTASKNAIAPLPIMSTGPGQPIAPAPPKPTTYPFPLFSGAATPASQHTGSHFQRPSGPASQHVPTHAFSRAPPVTVPQHHHYQHQSFAQSSVPPYVDPPPPIGVPPSPRNTMPPSPGGTIRPLSPKPYPAPTQPQPNSLPPPHPPQMQKQAQAQVQAQSQPQALPLPLAPFRPQQFVFQPPSGPLPAPVSAIGKNPSTTSSPRMGYGRLPPASPTSGPSFLTPATVPPSLAGNSSAPIPSRIPVTFVNQTVESRKAAARAKARKKVRNGMGAYNSNTLIGPIIGAGHDGNGNNGTTNKSSNANTNGKDSDVKTPTTKHDTGSSSGTNPTAARGRRASIATTVANPAVRMLLPKQ